MYEHFNRTDIKYVGVLDSSGLNLKYQTCIVFVKVMVARLHAFLRACLNACTFECMSTMHVFMLSNNDKIMTFLRRTKLKGMTFDHDFGYSFLFSLPSLKKVGIEKENELAKILIKSHAYQPGQFLETQYLYNSYTLA